MALRFDEAEVPHQMKDEDIWFRFFTKSQLMALAPVVGIDFVLIKITAAFKILPVGVTIAFVFSLAALVLVMIKIPENMYLYGIGKPLYVPIAQWLLRKVGKKKIYTKNYKDK
ncbi:MAG: hypothetical protein K6G88_11010 [Lachnospiraceae bacterium]|nr:hypothetical protein [Lachnospiraceae bacterium]